MSSKKILAFALSALLAFTLAPVSPEVRAAQPLADDPGDPNLVFISPRNINYVTEEAIIGSLERSTGYDARLDFPKTMSVVMPRDGMYVGSDVTNINWVDEGDPIATFSVVANDLEIDEAALALELAESVYKREIESYEANVSAAKASLEETIKTASGDSALRRAELAVVAAEENLDWAIYNGERNLESMRARLEDLRERSEDFTVYAPMSGYVYDIVYFSVGRSVPAWQLLCRISDPDPFQLIVNSSNLAQMRLGAQVSIETSRRDAPEFSGHVIGNTTLLDKHESDGRAVIAFDDPQAFLDFGEGSMQRLAGLRYRVNIRQADIQNVLLAPRRAVNTESSYRFVNILEDGLSKKRYVIVGLTNMDYAQILDGIKAGDLLITN